MSENNQTIGTPLDLDIDKFLFGGETKEETQPLVEDIFEDLNTTAPTEEIVEEVTSTPEPEEEPLQQVVKVTDYSELIKDLVESKEWLDVDVTIGEETVNILDLKDVDKDTFLLLKEQQEAEKKKEIQEKYISVEGLKDEDKKIIEIIKNGGREIATQILQSKPFIETIEEIEVTRNEEDLKGLIYQSYKSQNYEDDYIALKINSMVKNGTLDEEAQKIIDQVKFNYKQYIENSLKQIEEEKKQVEAQRLEFRKKLNETLKTYTLEDKDKRSILDTATKYDADGRLEAQKLFDKVREENPQLFIEAVMLLKDPKMYETIKTTKVKNNATLNTVKKHIILTPKTERKQGNKISPEKEFDEWFKQV